MSRLIRGVGRWFVVLSLLVGVGSAFAQDTPAKKKGTPAKKGTAKKAEGEMGMGMDGPAAKNATPAAAPAEGALSFKRDIAPILIANCVGCHSGNGQGVRTGKYDMTTFEKIMAGGKRGKDDVVAGDPDSSHMILMIKGEETPQMPPRNGQRGFSDEAAAKVEAWVKAGAILDAGLSRTDLLSKYAATADDLRVAELSKMSQEDRDKVAIESGKKRWAKATKDEVEVFPGPHFLLFAGKALSKTRADKILKAMEEQAKSVNALLSTPKGPALSPTEKISLYVFKDTLSFVEFVRTNENQEVESTEQARGRLNVESPYLAAVDPVAWGEEAAPSAPARKGARKTKKAADDSSGGPERSLVGLLTEQLVTTAANKAGKPPRWVSLGLGAFVASRIEPGSPYYGRLRAETAENIRIGWQPKANEALGGEGKTETTRAIGFSLFEWMAANGQKTTIPSFVRVMLEGQAKLDDAIGNCLNLNRESFLNLSGEWLMEHSGRR